MAVVVGYVPTREGQAALLRAATEASVRGTPLIVLDSTRPADDASADEVSAGEARAQLEALGGLDVSYEVRSVPPGVESSDELLRIAEDETADLLVIGLRRRTSVGKLILGAHAQRILLDAACPVLAVKPDAD